PKFTDHKYFCGSRVEFVLLFLVTSSDFAPLSDNVRSQDQSTNSLISSNSLKGEGTNEAGDVGTCNILGKIMSCCLKFLNNGRFSRRRDFFYFTVLKI